MKEYAKKKELKRRELEKLIKEGKIKMPEKKTGEDETLKCDEGEKNVFINEFGELRDDKGNIVKISD